MSSEVKKKNKIKIIRIIFQICMLTVVALFLVIVIFFPKTYEESDEANWNQSDGFIALSYVGVTNTSNNQLVSKDQLSQHFLALKEAGYVTIDADDIIAFYEKGQKLPDKALYIMFEDGRKDSIIFGEKLLKTYNYKATMMNYASNVVNDDDVFVKEKDMLDLEKSTFWENGSNGYRFSYINVKRIKELDGADDAEAYNKKNFEYNHYLMDYLRDCDGIPVESLKEMTDRINWDYNKMNSIYMQTIGYVPSVYAIMHAGGLFDKVDTDVEKANLDNIYHMFDVMFNQEGSCYNSAYHNIYNLTRMQVQPDWSASRLIKEIDNCVDNGIPFVVGQDVESRLEVSSGLAMIDGQDVVLTSKENQKTFVRLKGTDNWKDMLVHVGVAGKKQGYQKILLRKTDKSYIEISINQHRLTITEMVNGGSEKILFDGIMPGGESIQSNNDTFELKKRTLESGLEQVIWDLDIELENDKLKIVVNEIFSQRIIVDIDEQIEAGSVMLRSYSDEGGYNGIFNELSVEPILEEEED